VQQIMGGKKKFHVNYNIEVKKIKTTKVVVLFVSAKLC